MTTNIKNNLDNVRHSNKELSVKTLSKTKRDLIKNQYLNNLNNLSIDFNSITHSKTRLTVFYKYFCAFSYEEIDNSIDIKIKNKSRYIDNYEKKSDSANISRAHNKLVREIDTQRTININTRFEQLYYIQREIVVYTKYINEYEKAISTNSDTVSIFFSSKFNYIYVSKEDLKFFHNMLIIQKSKCEEELTFLNQCIDCIPESEHKKAFKYMYEENKTIDEVQTKYPEFTRHYKKKCFLIILENMQ